MPGSNGVDTVLERAKQAGKRVGNVSTAEITDATPAVLASHVSNRACQGPNDTRSLCPTETKAGGGLGLIAEQEVDHNIDVLLGGGKARFTQPLNPGGDKSVIDYARGDKDYRYVDSAAALDGVSSVQDRPLLGLFNAGNMTQEYQPLIATTNGAGSTDTSCVPDNRPANEPALPAMTSRRSSCWTSATATASSSRWRVPRSTSAITPRTSAARSARRSPSTTPLASP